MAFPSYGGREPMWGMNYTVYLFSMRGHLCFLCIMYSNLHVPQVNIVYGTLESFKGPSDLAFHSNSNSESSFETSHQFGHACWQLEVDADSYLFELNRLLKVVAFSFHQMRPRHYFLHPWGSIQNRFLKWILCLIKKLDDKSH